MTPPAASPVVRTALFDRARSLSADKREHVPFVVRGPVGFGKTTFLTTFARQCEDESEASLRVTSGTVRTALVPMEEFQPSPRIDATMAFQRLSERIAETLELDKALVAKLPWSRRLPSAVFFTAVETFLLRVPDTTAVLLFDNLDALRTARNGVEVFDLLRSLGDRNREPPFDRLQLVASSAVPLATLGRALSSLNHWTSLELDPFTLDELRELGWPSTLVGDDLTALLEETGGNPMLVEFARKSLESNPSGLRAWLARAEHDAVVERWYSEVARYLHGKRDALDAVRAMLRGEPMPQPVALELLRVGLIKANGALNDRDPAWPIAPLGGIAQRWLALQAR